MLPRVSDDTPLHRAIDSKKSASVKQSGPGGAWKRGWGPSFGRLRKPKLTVSSRLGLGRCELASILGRAVPLSAL
jgi:hypothetical protein